MDDKLFGVFEAIAKDFAIVGDNLNKLDKRVGYCAKGGLCGIVAGYLAFRYIEGRLDRFGRRLEKLEKEAEKTGFGIEDESE